MDPNTLNVIKGAAGAAGGDPVYVEDVFSTYVYAGTSAAHPITNGIDNSEKSLIWIKLRNQLSGYPYQNSLYDTESNSDTRYRLTTNGNTGSSILSDSVNSFNSNGFTLGSAGEVNQSPGEYVSWNFKAARGFFDVVAYTGDGETSQSIPHGLGSTPGMILIKCTNESGTNWIVYHRSIGATKAVLMDVPGYPIDQAYFFNDTAPNDTHFTVGNSNDVNTDEDTYVAYLFAHDEQSFGDDGDQSIIKCGAFTSDSNGEFSVSLGWEPQYVLFKRSNQGGSGNVDGSTATWQIVDVMRGWNWHQTRHLLANSSGHEITGADWSGYNTTLATGSYIKPTADGFDATAGAWGSSSDFIYMAIRRGPMKTPEDATKVFAVESISTPTSGTTKFTTNFPVDMSLANVPSGPTIGWMQDRLRGYPRFGTHATNTTWYRVMRTFDGNGESTFLGNNPFFLDADNTSMTYGNNTAGGANLSFAFGRAPGFFDVVCYTGNGTAGTVPHNLGAIPYLIIVKNRSAAYNWYVQSYDLGKDTWLQLNNAEMKAGNGTLFNSTLPTDSVFSVSDMAGNNTNGSHYVAYLFGKLPGICETGTYEGKGQSGGTTDLDFGFSPRFLLIKNADANNYNWALFDSATGMASSVGKYIRPNQNYDYSSGWTGANAVIDNITDGVRILDGNAASDLNASGNTYLYMAIA